jgi:hypothetical protein
MAKLTLTIDDAVLKKAQVRAIEQGTSLNAVLWQYLESFAGLRITQERALNDLLRLSRAATSRRGKRSWARDELHEQ